MAANPPVSLPSGFSCSPQQVLNRWEQTLYNLCEEYFYLNQKKSNRYPVLSQVRLNDAITLSHPVIKAVPVPLTVVGNVQVPAFSMDIQLTAMSFDVLITDDQGYPKAIFEADGKYHKQPTGLQLFSPTDAEAKVKDWAKQLTRDAYKDAIAKEARIPLFRLNVDGMHPHIEAVRAMLDNYPLFSRDVGYPTANGTVEYDVINYPDATRVMELEDIELLLVEANWPFPADWQYVTAYDLRHFHMAHHP